MCKVANLEESRCLAYTLAFDIFAISVILEICPNKRREGQSISIEFYIN